MNKIIHSVCNPDRKRMFATMTSVVKDKGKLSVEKSSLYSEGFEHIQNISDNYQLVKKSVGEQSVFKIVPAIVVDKRTVGFNYIKGKGLERIVGEYLEAGSIDKVLAVFERLEKVISVFPTVNVNPTKNQYYVKAFGEEYSSRQACLDPGVFDLNLDNFIVDNDDVLHMFDYEWVFSFPVPKKLLLHRVLFYTFISRYRQLIFNSGNKFKLVQLGDNTFVPEKIYSKYSGFFSNMRPFLDAEWHLQSHIHTIKPASFRDMFKSELQKTPKLVSAEDYSKKLKESNLIFQHEQVSSSFAEVLPAYENTRRELETIKQSKSYRYTNYARRKIKRLKPKTS